MEANNKDLIIKETILGVLKARDYEGDGVIHSSDFRMALSDLGFEMGSRIVEDILVLCKVDSHGNLDFSTLEHELVRSRRVLNSTASPAKPPPTSAGAQPKPWRADIVHDQKLKAERQKKLVQEFRPQIQDAFQKYARGTLSGDDLKSYIQSMGIEITRDFLSRTRINSTGDMTFAELVKSLISYDSNSNGTADPGFGAGGPLGGFVNSGQSNRKRVDWNKCKGQLEAPDPVIKPGRRPAETETVLRASKGVKDAVFSSVKDSTDFTTVSALHQASGQGYNSQVRYTTEQKVIREQVLAALRKLAAGELSMQEFHKIVFNMGIELPEVVVTLLERSLHTGHLEMHKVVQLLDGAVFKVLAAENVIDPAEIERIKADFMKKLQSKGSGSIASLAKLFAESDRDGNGVLSFSEFKNLCKNFGLGGSGVRGGLSDNDLRLLFLDYDCDGSGNIDFIEFKNAIRGILPAKRRNMVQLAFKKVDRHGDGTIAWDFFVRSWEACYHPDVQSGRKTIQMVLNDWQSYCTKSASGLMNLSYVEFMDIFTDLSSMMQSDDEFESMIRNSFGLDPTFAPATPDYTIHAAGSNLSNHTPLARQAHGDCISWTQEECSLEKMEKTKFAVPIRKANANKRNNSDPLGQNKDYTVPVAPQMRHANGNSKNKSNVTCFTWEQPHKRAGSDEDDQPRRPAIVNLSGTGVTTGQGHIYSTSNTASSQYFPENHTAAGNNHKVAELNGFSRSDHGAKWSAFKQREYSGGTPFGVDSKPMDLMTSNAEYGGAQDNSNTRNGSPRSQRQQSGGGGNVKSLAELLASRNHQQ